MTRATGSSSSGSRIAWTCTSGALPVSIGRRIPGGILPPHIFSQSKVSHQHRRPHHRRGDIGPRAAEQGRRMSFHMRARRIDIAARGAPAAIAAG